MEHNTSKKYDKVCDEILKDVTGGCQGCNFVGSLVVKQGREAEENITRSAMNNNLRSAIKETARHENLYHAMTQVAESVGKPAIGGGFIHCENFGALVKGVSKHIRP